MHKRILTLWLLVMTLPAVAPAQQPCADPCPCPLCVPAATTIKVTKVNYATRDAPRCYRLPDCWRFCFWRRHECAEPRCAAVTVKTIIKRGEVCEKPTVQCAPPAAPKP